MDGFTQKKKVEVLFDTQHGHSGQYTIESHRKGPKWKRIHGTNLTWNFRCRSWPGSYLATTQEDLGSFTDMSFPVWSLGIIDTQLGCEAMKVWIQIYIIYIYCILYIYIWSSTQDLIYIYISMYTVYMYTYIIYILVWKGPSNFPLNSAPKNCPSQASHLPQDWCGTSEVLGVASNNFWPSQSDNTDKQVVGEHSRVCCLKRYVVILSHWKHYLSLYCTVEYVVSSLFGGLLLHIGPDVYYHVSSEWLDFLLRCTPWNWGALGGWTANSGDVVMKRKEHQGINHLPTSFCSSQVLAWKRLGSIFEAQGSIFFDPWQAFAERGKEPVECELQVGEMGQLVKWVTCWSVNPG